MGEGANKVSLSHTHGSDAIATNAQSFFVLSMAIAMN